MKREKAEPSRAGFVSCFDRLTAGFFVEFVHFGDDLVVALRHVAVGCCGELSVDVNELHAENLRFTLDKSSIKK